jgi:hypothetical protein
VSAAVKARSCVVSLSTFFLMLANVDAVFKVNKQINLMFKKMPSFNIKESHHKLQNTAYIVSKLSSANTQDSLIQSDCILPTKTDPLSKKRSWLLVLYSH